MINLKLARIDSDYCDYLRKYDQRVIYNRGKKELRPFVGVLFRVDDREYFAPLSSPKHKHLKMRDNLDFFKISKGELGGINFNNMIPVQKVNYGIIEFAKEKPKNLEERLYLNLLQKQLTWMNENYSKIKNKSCKLYNMYINDKLNASIKNRCCNFPLLEEKCDEYNSNQKVSV